MATVNNSIPSPADFPPGPLESLESSVVARFEEIVNLYPERVAVMQRGQSLTYRALNTAANQLAQGILKSKPTEDTAVMLLLGHDPSAIVALMAVLKAGRPFVALHPANPIERMK